MAACNIKCLPQDLLESYKIPDLTNNDYHACILYDQEDKQAAVVKKELEKAHFRLCTSEDIEYGQLVLAGKEELIRKSKRVILIITQNYLDSSLATYDVIMAQMKSNREEGKVTILILHEINPDKVPSYMLEVNYIRSDDVCFWERVLTALTEVIPMSALIDTTGIAEGLAWSYYEKYLTLILPSLEERMSERFVDSHICWLPVLFLLLPTNGHCKQLKSIDDCIKCERPLRLYCNVACAKRRDYSTHIVTVKDPNSDKECCVAMEYVTPVHTMFEMTRGQIAGLSEEGMKSEISQLKETLSNILETCHPGSPSVYLLSYDEKEQREHFFSSWVFSCIGDKLADQQPGSR